VFTQALQTEVNKPLEIVFKASNQQESGWFARILFWAGAFLALWIVCATALFVRNSRRTA
jgi:hypothetical protein